MRIQYLAIACLAGVAFAAPFASAQTAADPRAPTASDVVTKPLTDMNIKKDDIPSILIAARDTPYGMAGLRTCPAIQSEVRKLDTVLGDDIDVTQGEKRGVSVGRLAQSIVGSFIPFGGVIREISGANEQQRQWNLAIYAGSVRRAYLKGVGQQKGCRYPARAATAADVTALERTRQMEHDRAVVDKNADKAKDRADDKRKAQDHGKADDNVNFESRAVVQPTRR